MEKLVWYILAGKDALELGIGNNNNRCTLAASKQLELNYAVQTLEAAINFISRGQRSRSHRVTRLHQSRPIVVPSAA